MTMAKPRSKRTPLSQVPPTTSAQVKDCSSCGACCQEQAALPLGWYAGMGGFDNLPDDIQGELRAAREKFDAEGWPADGTPCIWLDQATKKCSHYEHRPQVCRDGVAVGDEACRRWRRAKGVDKGAARYGMKGGKLVRVTP